VNDPAPTIDALLAEARALGVDRLDAQLLLAHHLGRPRAWVLAHGDACAGDAAPALRADLHRRADGVPLAYLTGRREFHGLVLEVTPAVLDPRPDTETLVDWAIELLDGPLAARPAPRVVDLGTGSGAVALAIAAACERALVCGVDFDAGALAVARSNGRRLRLPVQWAQGDWWAAVPPPAVDLAVANPPYIAADDRHLEALVHEPRAALTPGASGLEAIEAIVAGAADRLAPAGWLLLEHGFDQGPAVRSLLAAAGFAAVSTRCDLAGHERCTGARLETVRVRPPDPGVQSLT
jgi:release factor glutamine methyltransferase